MMSRSFLHQKSESHAPERYANSFDVLKPSNSEVRARHFRCCLLIGCAAFFLSQSGCQVFQRFRAPTSVPVAFQTAPNKFDLMQHLQTQSDRATQIEADVKVSMDGMPSLRGTLAIERPDSLRLKAGVMGMTDMGIDVGSNAEVFWVWSKVATPNNPSAIYFARHSEYQSSKMRQMLPLEPQWIIDALGFVEFSPTDQHAEPFVRPDKQIEIRSTIMTPQGPNKRVCVIDSTRGFVTQQAFYDKSNQLIAYVNSKNQEYDSDSGVSLPKRIELYVRQSSGETTKLVINANSYRVNSIFGDRSRLWLMPSPGDVSAINLAEVGGGSTDLSTRQLVPEVGTARHTGRRSSQSWYVDQMDPTARYLR